MGYNECCRRRNALENFLRNKASDRKARREAATVLVFRVPAPKPQEINISAPHVPIVVFERHPKEESHGNDYKLSGYARAFFFHGPTALSFWLEANGGRNRDALQLGHPLLFRANFQRGAKTVPINHR